MEHTVISKERVGMVRVSTRTLYSIFVALIPIIMVFRVPVVEMGVSTVLLGVFLPYALLQRSKRETKVSIIPIAVVVCYIMFRSTDNLRNLFLLFVVMVHAFGASRGSIDIRVARKTMENVALFASVCVIIQTLCYYGLGFHLNFFIKELVLQENQHKIISEFTGAYYRPRAFFLEPAHMAQYSSLAIVSVLYPMKEKKADIKRAIAIALGVLLTTSGIGIALCLGVFGWYALFSQRKKGTKVIYLFGWSIAFVAATAILMQFSFFRFALQRVFGEVDGYNAIWGRTLFWKRHVGSLIGTEVFFGRGTLYTMRGFMTGLMEVISCYGYVGVGGLLLMFLSFFIYGRDQFVRCGCIIFCALMCVADMFSFLSLTHWICLIVGQIYEPKQIALKND